MESLPGEPPGQSLLLRYEIEKRMRAVYVEVGFCVAISESGTRRQLFLLRAACNFAKPCHLNVRHVHVGLARPNQVAHIEPTISDPIIYALAK